MNVHLACADCLEDAGGRQQRHNIAWRIDYCGCCGVRKAVTDPLNFGAPPLQPKILPLTERQSA